MTAIQRKPEMQRYFDNKMLTMRANTPGFFRDVYTCAKCRKAINSGEKFYKDVREGFVAHITCPKKGKVNVTES